MQLISMLALLITINGCDNSVSSPDLSDLDFHFSGYILPVQYPQSHSVTMNVPSVSSAAYRAKFYVFQDNNGIIGNSLGDAIITVNGNLIHFDTINKYYQATLTGPFSVGSTFTVSISHSGMDAITLKTTVPSSVVPSNYTTTPQIDSLHPAPPYEVIPETSWSTFGCVTAMLFDKNLFYQGYYDSYPWNGTNGPLFSVEDLQYGAQKIQAAQVQFWAWSMNVYDFHSYGMNGSTPSRIRIWSVDGFKIAGTF